MLKLILTILLLVFSPIALAEESAGQPDASIEVQIDEEERRERIRENIRKKEKTIRFEDPCLIDSTLPVCYEKSK